MATRTADTDTAERLGRFTAIAVFATPANFIVYLVAWTALKTNPTTANVLAAMIVNVPVFMASRRWVWAPGPSLRREVIGFWLSSLINVGFATVALHFVGRMDPPGVLVAVLPFTCYTLLWFARFVVLDRWVFKRNDSGESTRDPGQQDAAASRTFT